MGTMQLPMGPVQLLEVEAEGVFLRDHGREAVNSMIQAVSAAVAASPGAAASSAGGSRTGYSLEARDISIEVEDPPMRCSLPCVRTSSFFGGLEDMWSFTSWGTPVTRTALDPLGGSFGEPAVRPWWESPRKALLSDTPRRRGGGAADVIGDLEQRLAQQRQALGTERARSEQLEAKLGEVLKILRSWPEGPMPLAMQSLVAELPSSTAHHVTDPRRSETEDTTVSSPSPKPDQQAVPNSSVSPTASLGMSSVSPTARCDRSGHALPGVELVNYSLNPTSEAVHVVQCLRRGDAVQWFLEEVSDRAVNVKVVLRSRRRLHAARCLRETESLTRRRDFFEVTDEFGEDQLPMSLVIHFSNTSWFSERHVRLRLCRVDRLALHSSAPPWPALAPLHEEEASP